MTGTACYERAVALIGLEPSDATYFVPMALPCLNQMLADCLWEHNARCRLLGVQGLNAAPEMEDLEEEIPYDGGLVAECFPYGLAALLVQDDDRTAFRWLKEAYEERLNHFRPCVITAMQEEDDP